MFARSRTKQIGLWGWSWMMSLMWEDSGWWSLHSSCFWCSFGFHLYWQRPVATLVFCIVGMWIWASHLFLCGEMRLMVRAVCGLRFQMSVTVQTKSDDSSKVIYTEFNWCTVWDVFKCPKTFGWPVNCLGGPMSILFIIILYWCMENCSTVASIPECNAHFSWPK